MKIVVLNGSPKGSLSVTMQYVAFIQKKFPQHELDIVNISQRIKTIERDEKAFREIIDKVKHADGVLWAFPLYSLLVPSQYKRFIELIRERNCQAAFRDKYTAALSTSIHFYDHAAHDYMNAICDDLGMKYVGPFSADMHDLMKEGERKRLVLFAEDFFDAITNNIATAKSCNSLPQNKLTYIPASAENKISPGNKKITIITDSDGSNPNLDRMIDRFAKSFLNGAEVANLNSVDIKGGCQGCLHCALENICAYKDGFAEFYSNKIKSSDVLIYAGSVKDRYLSSKWKQFFDRSFFNTHIPMLRGKQIGFIVSGPLSQMRSLREVLEAYAECEHANVAGFITDEYETSPEIDALLQGFASRIVRFSNKNYAKPPTFLGVAGMKLFRDDIWGRMRFVFQADHRFYKKHGIYDFPQKNFKTRIFNAIMMLLTKIPPIRRAFVRKMRQLMVEPYQKIVKQN